MLEHGQPVSRAARDLHEAVTPGRSGHTRHTVPRRTRHAQSVRSRIETLAQKTTLRGRCRSRTRSAAVRAEKHAVVASIKIRAFNSFCSHSIFSETRLDCER